MKLLLGQITVDLAVALAAAMAGALVYTGDLEVLPAAALLGLLSLPAILVHAGACHRGVGAPARAVAYWLPAALTGGLLGLMALLATVDAAAAGYSDGSDEMGLLMFIVVLCALVGAGAVIMIRQKRTPA